MDVLAPFGTPLLRAATNFTVNKFQFAGPDFKKLWMVGNGGVNMVKWALQGMALEYLVSCS